MGAAAFLLFHVSTLHRTYRMLQSFHIDPYFIKISIKTFFGYYLGDVCDILSQD